MMVMYTSDLIGKEVIGAEGWNIGKVREILIDKDSWAITALSIGLESNVAKELNMKKMWGRSDLTIPIAHVQGVADRIVLKLSKSQILDIAKTGTQNERQETPETRPQ